MTAKQFINIKSPLTDEIIGKVPAMSREEVDVVIQKAKAGFKVWRSKPLYERVEYLYKVANLLLENEEELTSLLIREVGKDQKSAKSEVVRTADLIKFTADTAKNMHG